MKKEQNIKISLENVENDSIIVASSYKNGEFKVKFLTNLEDYVGNAENCIVLNNNDKLVMNYKFTYEVKSNA